MRNGKGPQKSADNRIAEGHGRKSEAVRERAIVALLADTTIERAAARCGINERTLRRWLTEDPIFQSEYAAARRATFTLGMSGVQSLTSRAVNVLGELLEAKNSPSVRLGAVRTVIEIGTHQYDAETILRRLDEIEAAQRRQEGRT